MISRLSGTLVNIDKEGAQVRVAPGVDVEVLLPVHASSRLATSIGQPVELHTLVFLESLNQGAVLLPRLAGFPTPDDRSFYQLLTTVKGIGHRRGLRSMVMDARRLATAIADRDVKLLQTMPEVGKKTAETIVITLQDKVERFLSAPARGGKGTTVTESEAGVAEPSGAGGGGIVRDATEALVSLGESRADAADLIDRIMRGDEPPASVEAIIAAVYRMRAG